MRITSNIKSKKLFILVILCLLFLTAVLTAFCLGGASIFAHAEETEDFDNNSNQVYLSVQYTDGSMGMIVDESYCSDESVSIQANYANLRRTTVRSSGLSDAHSIVAVFLGEGFTETEQQDFIDRVTEISNYMVTVEPFNYYANYLTVYAVHSISNESGVSGEVGGKFACRDSSGNPATAQCTPVDSSVFNCIHGKDTYYHSYYQWRSSAGRVILEMSSTDRERAKKDALAASPYADMVQVIVNSEMRGGTSSMPTPSQSLGVAVTSINKANPNADWKETTMHEFGHGFGGLWDEYWNGITPSEYPNVTRDSNSTTVKWSHLVGYKNVGVYPFAASEWDGNPNQATNSWYRPHQTCMMRQTSNPFCSVCVQTLLDKMEAKTGVPLSDFKDAYFNVTLLHETKFGTMESRVIKVAYGEKMPTPTDYYAPRRDGYEFMGYYSQANGNGIQYYSKDIEYKPPLLVSGTYIDGYREIMVSSNSWNIFGDGKLYAYWKLLETDYSYENIWIDNGLLEPSTVHLTHGTNVTITAKKISGYTFQYFQYGYDKLYSETITVYMELHLSQLEGIVRPVGEFFAAYEKDPSCVAEGTLITLADGKQVPVESLTDNEQLLVWNLNTGTFDTAPVLFIDKEPTQLNKVINLSFSDGTNVKVISEHGFWDCNLNKYVYLDENAMQYIGHWFNKQSIDEDGNPISSCVQLTDVVIAFENTAAYSPVTYSHLCYYVNGMLSMPGGIGGLFNIFKVNSETMKYDEAAMAADIEKYGLFTYEELSTYISVSEEVFEAFNGQYLKIAIGKGLISIETLNYLAERYSCFFNAD